MPEDTAGTRLTQAERAYRTLKRLILDDALPAGTQLLEEEVAARLGVSRTPAREAMQRLARDGLIALRPRHGLRVLPVSARDMREIYEILTPLEATAAELAAAARPDAAALAPLEEAVHDMDAALAASDLAAWAQADERFHLALVRLSGNRRLEATVEGFWDQAHRARMATLRLRPPPRESVADHAALIAVIRAGDAGRARAMHEDHRRRAGVLLVGLLERLAGQAI